MIAACKTPGTAADLCAGFTLNGIGGWFLPSVDELTQMYINLKLAGIGDLEHIQGTGYTTPEFQSGGSRFMGHEFGSCVACPPDSTFHERFVAEAKL
jgi:hypothetical protein